MSELQENKNNSPQRIIGPGSFINQNQFHPQLIQGPAQYAQSSQLPQQMTMPAVRQVFLPSNYQQPQLITQNMPPNIMQNMQANPQLVNMGSPVKAIPRGYMPPLS